MEQKKEDEKEIKEEKVESVTLTKEQYAALLDRVAELEDASLRKEKDIWSLNELTEEGKKAPKQTKEEEEPDWDNISGKELVQRITEAVNQAGVKLQTEIETLKVMREIDKCEAKYKDFWEHEEEMRKIAMENPSLSIEKAYQLAKIDKEGEKKEEGVAKTKTEKLLNLPPRSEGEKPGVVPSSTKASEVKTLREAALKAWDETVGKGKTEI